VHSPATFVPLAYIRLALHCIAVAIRGGTGLFCDLGDFALYSTLVTK
jgi:hypothetical protein